MSVGDFHVDENVINNRGGAPPTGHARRCQAYNHAREQCGRWALTGVHYCQFHGGRQSLLKLRKMETRNPLSSDPINFYAKRAGPKLRKLIQDVRESFSPRERLSLANEIEVARMLAMDSMGTLSACMDNIDLKNEDGTKAITPQMVEAAKGAVKESLNHVSHLIQLQAKNEALLADGVSAEALDYHIGQVSKILNVRLGDDPRLPLILADMENIRVAETNPQTKRNIVLQAG